MREKLPIALSELAEQSIANSLPFAFYHLPGSKVIKVMAQETSALHKFKRKEGYSNKAGFLFAPFVESRKAYSVLIQPDRFLAIPIVASSSSAKARSKKEKENKLEHGSAVGYTLLVEKIKRQIGKGKFSKIVAARVIRKQEPTGFDASKFFLTLCNRYPHSFASLVYTPEFGLWAGASPEILLQHDGSSFKTYALAGTKQNTGDINKTAFGKKEQEEQQIVSEYIAQTVEKIANEKPIIIGPEVVEAGNLLHLRTTFAFDKLAGNKWQKIVQALHPTPAVAGIPKGKAISFIQKNETEARGFYSGYLGPVNIDGQINLYVNLRCMQVKKNKLKIYVGCGITANSDANEEWKETEMKSRTMLDVLTNKSNH